MPQENIYANSADARITASSTSFATARSATTGTLNSASNPIGTGDQLAGSTYSLNRIHQRFASTVSGVVSSVNYKIEVAGIFSGNSKTIHLVESSASDTVVADDYNNIGSVSFGSVLLDSTGVKTISLNAAGIAYVQANLGGTIKLAIIGEHDYNNDTTGINDFGVSTYTGNETTNQKPKLEITYDDTFTYSVTRDLDYYISNEGLIQKTLSYKSKPTYSLTKDTQYTVLRTLSPITKALGYGIRINDLINKTVDYRVVTDDQINKTLSYKSKPSYGLTKSVQYTIYRTVAALTRSLQYEIQPPSVVLLAFDYAILRAIGIEKDLAYRILTGASLTKQFAYAILNSNSFTKTLEYSVLISSLVQKDLSYVVLNNPSISNDLNYYIINIDNLIQKTLDYIVLLQTDLTKDIQYKVKAGFPITQSMSYRIGIGGYIDNYTSRGTTYNDDYQYTPRGTTYNDQY